jgi:hypothetical protein
LIRNKRGKAATISSSLPSFILASHSGSRKIKKQESPFHEKGILSVPVIIPRIDPADYCLQMIAYYKTPNNRTACNTQP